MIPESMKVQWWLAQLDQHGNPELCDGAHETQDAANRAYYLYNSLGLSNKDERYAVVRVELFEAEENKEGVNKESLKILQDVMEKTK